MMTVVEIIRYFEENATANFIMTELCEDWLYVASHIVDKGLTMTANPARGKWIIARRH